MSVYDTVSFTTASVGPGADLDVDVTVSGNYIDIYKIQIVPSVVGGTTVAKIYTAAARAAGNLLYKTLAWDDAVFTDPIEDVGGVYNYRNEGFVARYEDADLAGKLYLTITNNDAVAKTYDVIIITSPSPYAPSALGVPMDIHAAAFANGLTITSGVEAWVNNVGITEAELRMKFYALGSSYPQLVDMSTAAEGGSFADNGTTQRIFTAIPANKTGAQYAWASGSAGRWYFVWKLENASGWSKWSDGNEYPTAVVQWVDTVEGEDTGPPAGWQVTLEKAKATNYYTVRVSRPRTYGNLILWWSAQIKDASVGAWRALDANAGAAVTEYDGSGVDHTFDTTTNILTAPAGWGTASVGDLLLIDVRGTGVWAIEHCVFATIETLSGNDITIFGGGGRLPVRLTATKVGNNYTEVRVKIVKAPWAWNTEGYLGDQANNGLFNGAAKIPPGWPLFDRETKQFVSDPIYIPPTVVSPQARVWFQNGYSRNDDNVTVSAAIDGGHDIYTSGFAWYSFVDRDWWIPTITQGDNVVMTLESAGTIKCEPAPITPAINKMGVCGAAGRFRIYQDSTGVVQVRCKWTFNATYSASPSGDSFIVGMLLDLEEMEYVYLGRQLEAHGMGFKPYSNSGSGLLELRFAHVKGPSENAMSLSNMWDPLLDGTTEEIITPAPAMPCVVEMRLTVDEDSVNLTVPQVVMKTYEYQINSGGWNTIAFTPGQYMYGQRTPNGGIRGYIPRLLYCQTAVHTGDYVRLTEFEVIKGILARE